MVKKHKRGDTLAGSLWYLKEANGTPKNLTGWRFDLEFRSTAGATGPAGWSLSTAAPPGGLVLLDGDGVRVATVAGVATVLVARGYPWLVEMVAAIPPLTVGSWPWDIQYTSPGFVQTFDSGTLAITQDVTRP